MFEGGEVHVGRGYSASRRGNCKSLQILDQAVDISGYVNSNHVWTGIKEASFFESQSRI